MDWFWYVNGCKQLEQTKCLVSPALMEGILW